MKIYTIFLLKSNSSFLSTYIGTNFLLFSSREDSMMNAIRSLLEKIPDINQVPVDPTNGRTPLMYAVEKEEGKKLYEINVFMLLQFLYITIF